LHGIQGPAHGQHDFVILKQVGKFTAGRPEFADVGFEFEQFLLDGFELRVGKIVKLMW